ncbi:methyltransferase [Kineobactrum salinum]|uniref:Class I SAM-dependent methyltransferase n=1 Tax=Kineobactrum salinum TaxID=2708301 RepID=A0A6C0U662_9GAMM|nr:methyltransferase [Kineobactrum salinum]QIB67438.1 class I SAM-dependent methyltransferase [Kineobactrum salinum]
MSEASDPASATGVESDYETPFGRFNLIRYPARRKEMLRAWCGADTLLLETVAESGLGTAFVLTVNDEHGALSLPLAATALWTDSALAALALEANRQRNASPPPAIIWSVDLPTAPLPLVVLRVPKHKALLEYQLSRLAPLMPDGARLLAAGMDKHLPADTRVTIECYIGPTDCLPGRHKAHCFSARRDDRVAAPIEAWTQYRCEPLGANLASLPGVFSRARLDSGSRLLLEQLEQLRPVQRLADLACGNGVLGLAALQRGLARELLFCDESAMALASARVNLERLAPEMVASAVFHHGDGLRDWKGPAAQLILCNPPFHLQHTVDDYAGRRLLAQAATALAPAGELCLVANRHLDYRPALQPHFSQIRELARNRKFTVYLARRR